MNKNEKIFIAGHRGMVGSALQRKLVKEGYVSIITRENDEMDMRRQSDVEAFFEKEKPDYVFLAAAKVGGILANSTYKAEFIYDNMMIAANTIQASYKYGVKKLLNLGSSCIYPKMAPQPLEEKSLLTGSLEPTNEPYAIAKIAAIKLCRYYNEQYGTNYISVMPTNLYGPNDNYNLETGHVLPALIRRFHEANITNQKTVILWGTGEPFREFLYVEDLAEACILLMSKYEYAEIGEFVNIGSGQDIRIRELVEVIIGIVGYKGVIEWDHTKPDGTPKKQLDVSRIHKLGWKAKVGLSDGIKLAYEWFIKEYDSIVRK